MAVVARTNKPRPGKRGLVVEVHDRPGLLGKADVYDLAVILWSPAFGAHVHNLQPVKGKARAVEIAEHIGQARIQIVHRKR